MQGFFSVGRARTRVCARDGGEVIVDRAEDRADGVLVALLVQAAGGEFTGPCEGPRFEQGVFKVGSGPHGHR